MFRPLSILQLQQPGEMNLDFAWWARTEQNKTEINKFILIVSSPPLLIMVQLPRHQGALHPCFVLSGPLWHRHSQRLSVFFSSALWMCSPTTSGQGWGAPTSLGSQLSPDLLCHRWSLTGLTSFCYFQIPFQDHFKSSCFPPVLWSWNSFPWGSSTKLKVKVLSVHAPGAEQHDPDPLHSHQTGLWVWISLASGPSSPTNWPTFTPGSASFQNQIMRPTLSCSRSWDPSLQNSSLLLGLPNPPLVHIFHFLLLPLFPTSSSYPRADKIV